MKGSCHGTQSMWLSVTTRAFLPTSSLCSCPIFHHEQAHPHPFAHRTHSFPRDSSGYLPGTREQSAFHISVLIFLYRILWGKELFSHFTTGELRLKKNKKLSNFPWSSQLVSHRVKTYTQLQNPCALLPAFWWIFCHLEHVEEKDILSWLSRCDLLRSSCSLTTSLPSLVRHMDWILPSTRHKDTWG